jgi:glycine/D-amino acid oxidase-like deaminating enzyme
MGGASATAGDEHPALLKHLQRAAAIRFPQLGSLQWEYGWSGYLALTPDHLPVVHEHEDGIFAGIGCNGRGIAMATAVGGLLAELADGGDEKSGPIPIRTSRRFRGFSLRRPGVAMAVRINRAMDTLERWL